VFGIGAYIMDFNFTDEDLRYSGELKAGVPHGKGLAIYQNGDEYDGGWHEGCKHGLGTYIWPGGRALTGIWEEGAQPSLGEWKWIDGRMFADRSEFFDAYFESLYCDGLLNLDRVLFDQNVDALTLIPEGNLSAYLVTEDQKKQEILDLIKAGDSNGEFSDFVEGSEINFLERAVYTFSDSADLVLINAYVDGELLYWVRGKGNHYSKGPDVYECIPSGYNAGVLVFLGIHWKETFTVTTSGEQKHLETGFEDDGW
jgi:hypothetical protein